MKSIDSHRKSGRCKPPAESRAERSGQTDPRWLLVAILLTATVLVVAPWRGCRQYPVVQSAEALETIKRVYVACSARDLIRLERAETEIRKLREKATAAELAAFESIVALARKGEWEMAQTAALRFAADQVR